MRTYFAATQVGAGTTDGEVITNDIGRISVALIFLTSATAKVQTTLSSDAEITAGTAVWEDWAAGAKTAYFSASMYAPQGIRLNNSGAGNVKMMVRGNYN